MTDWKMSSFTALYCASRDNKWSNVSPLMVSIVAKFKTTDDHSIDKSDTEYEYIRNAGVCVMETMAKEKVLCDQNFRDPCQKIFRDLHYYFFLFLSFRFGTKEMKKKTATIAYVVLHECKIIWVY